MCSVPGEPPSQNSRVVTMINMNITQWIQRLYGQDEPAAGASVSDSTPAAWPVKIFIVSYLNADMMSR